VVQVVDDAENGPQIQLELPNVDPEDLVVMTDVLDHVAADVALDVALELTEGMMGLDEEDVTEAQVRFDCVRIELVAGEPRRRCLQRQRTGCAA
jgi:hypothetical protein